MLRTIWLPCCLLLATAAASSEYEYLDLGTLGGDAVADDLNESGVVVGSSWTGGVQHAVLFDGGAVLDLHPPTGRPRSRGAGINESGHVVVTAFGAANNQASIWRDGTWEHLPGKRDGSDINDFDQVSGAEERSRWLSYRWEGGTEVRIHDVLGATQTSGNALNNAGVVVGEAANLVSGGWSATAFASDGIEAWWVPSLGLPADAPRREGIEGADINDGNVMVGRGETAAREEHAFVFDLITGELQDIHPVTGPLAPATRSRALGINVHGAVVGDSDGPWGAEPHAFLWQDDEFLSLHDFLPPEMVASTARAVNDAGCIAGSAQDGAGRWHAFKLCPTTTQSWRLRVLPRALNTRASGLYMVAMLTAPDLDASESLIEAGVELTRIDGLEVGEPIVLQAHRLSGVKWLLKLDRQALSEFVRLQGLADDGELELRVTGDLVGGQRIEALDLIGAFDQGRRVGEGRRRRSR